MHNPALELPNDAPLKNVHFSRRIHDALTAAGFRTVGDVRGTSDARLLIISGLDQKSVGNLRKMLGVGSGKPSRLGPKARRGG